MLWYASESAPAMGGREPVSEGGSEGASERDGTDRWKEMQGARERGSERGREGGRGRGQEGTAASVQRALMSAPEYPSVQAHTSSTSCGPELEPSLAP